MLYSTGFQAIYSAVVVVISFCCFKEKLVSIAHAKLTRHTYYGIYEMKIICFE